jgi:hypothetical protein
VRWQSARPRSPVPFLLECQLYPADLNPHLAVHRRRAGRSPNLPIRPKALRLVSRYFRRSPIPAVAAVASVACNSRYYGWQGLVPGPVVGSTRTSGREVGGLAPPWLCEHAGPGQRNGPPVDSRGAGRLCVGTAPGRGARALPDAQGASAGHGRGRALSVSGCRGGLGMPSPRTVSCAARYRPGPRQARDCGHTRTPARPARQRRPSRRRRDGRIHRLLRRLAPTGPDVASPTQECQADIGASGQRTESACL